MTITRTKPDFFYSGVLTSDEVDAIDTNITNALDRRDGYSDTLASAVTVTGSLDIEGEVTVSSGAAFTVDADADTVINFFGSGNGAHFQADSTLSTTNTSVVDLHVGEDSSIEIDNDGAINVNAGGDINLDGSMHVTGSIQVKDGASLQVEAGSGLYLESGSTVSCSTNIQLNGSSEIFRNTFKVHSIYMMGTENRLEDLANWSYSSGTLLGDGTGDFMRYKLPVINGAILSSIQFHYRLSGSGRSPSTGNRLQYTLYRAAKTAPTTLATIGSTQYANYSGTYLTVTSVTWSDIAETIDTDTYLYILAVTDENGSSSTNSVAGFTFTYLTQAAFVYVQ